MSSIIEGYNYDIFISYRQKDNKGDRWVSRFVEALKTEIEATFKEDVSVYFDENPHDRLQETHNVDKSLEGKLKCLIFLPILSQTYCDPNSYAWQYEFLIFNKLVNEDRFGRDIRLKNGNYASRILPIRIHDLDQEDVKLFEKETGSVLRAIDFIFKTTTGVSRPLKANEDHPQDNLNKTFYSDQINKVGHAIKEIILGLKTVPSLGVKEKDQAKEPFKEVREDKSKITLEKPTKAVKSKLLSTIAVLAIFIIAAIFTYPKIFNRDKLANLKSSYGRISIAIMPFHNMTNDTIWNVWQNGIQDILVTYLSNSPEELKVRQTESINDLIRSKGLTNYASITPSVASTLSQKLDANVFIFGSIKQAGTTIRLNAQLIESKTEETFKSFEIDGPAQEEMIFQITDSLKRMVKNYLLISKLRKELPVGYKYYESTNSPEAFKYFIYGQNAFYRKDFPAAAKLFSQAIAIDSNFISAYFSLGTSYGNQGMLEEATKLVLKFYGKRDQLPIQLKTRLNGAYAYCFETPFEEIKYIKQLQEFDDQEPRNYYNLGEAYTRINQYDEAIPEFEEALGIYKRWDSKPLWAPNYTMLGYAYHKTGQYKKEEKLYKKAEQDFPYDHDLIYRQTVLSLSEGNAALAKIYIQKLRTLLKEISSSEAGIITDLAMIYSEAGIPYQAEEYYRKALSLEPESPLRFNNLARFLIDNDGNINEGIDLVEKALELGPDNYVFLHTKGWGLYKQGKYQEALDLLQKSWDLRRRKEGYDHSAYLHLEEAKKAVAGQKNDLL